MSYTDLFKIILKVVGFYLLVSLAQSLPTFIYFITVDSSMESMVFNFLAPLILIIIIAYLILKPQLFIRLFKLDQGFDTDKIEWSSKRGMGIIQAGLIVIGIYLIAVNIGYFLTQLTSSFVATMSPGPQISNQVNVAYIIEAGISIGIGFLLLTNFKRVAKWIEKVNASNLEG